ncbi:amino acid-binding protein (plasmid) [Azospirillum baldaniorum]|uniref:Leu/ile/val-binding protein n=2 Tax=Azospirillum TaxID=191 RepID=A0A9P1JYS3_9PROT|nr:MULTISPECIES: ABC transporter substrate-binding protein [Azospirillum]TWA76178.1 amino acid/amide ABC transporter substrate-binding protein (HAAT family) [Azospirillum brasilense]AWJ93055.1 amino acid-binding protein [Azospirillum baldaniorum]NUB11051.1 ABC transporter substrate-binding protein [Azospirillum baldaniorum]PNQ99778.1 amino acid-binding protein [Azospirillum argentinense]CCD02356.1 putative leu/ile/val-binding protein [Azospirillum baldaniorum]
MHRRSVIRLLGAAVTLTSALALSAGSAAAQDTIKIGMTSALTGPYNEYGEGGRRGVELAIEKWNAKGGINGKKVELAMLLDDQLVPDRAVQNMRRLLDNKELVAIIGPAGSGPTLAVIEMAAADGRPYMNPVAQTPTVTYPDGGKPRPNVFSFALQNDVESMVLGRYVATQFKKPGLVHESTAYGVSGADMIAKELKAAGGAAVATETYNQRAQDVTAQIARLQRAGADVVVCVGLGADLAVIRRTMARLNFNVPLVASNGALSIPYQEAAGDLVTGTRGSMVYVFGEETLNPAAQGFADAYKAKYGTDRWWGNDPQRPQIFMSLSVSNAYDAADVLFEGIKRANSTDPKAIATAIEGIQGLRGVNATYSFSATKHHAIAPEDVAIFEYVKTGDKIGLTIVKN